MINQFLARPYATVSLLLGLNAAVFLLCLRAVGTPFIPTGFLVAHGALIPEAIRAGEVWRLVTAGFLHANPIHLMANLVSLAICGPFLERRLGASAFILVYGASMVGAGFASVSLHAGGFVSVGASGAISGVIGALFALWVLGERDLSPGFFLGNFALNFAIAARDPNIDWTGHIGGFAVGIAGVAVLDIIARANGSWLRCKFPEYVKTNALLLAAAGSATAWFYPIALRPPFDARWAPLAVGIVGLIVAIKALDLLLAARHGLVGVVLLFAVGNGLAAWEAAEALRPILELDCRSAIEFGAFTNAIGPMICGNADAARYALGACGFLLTFAAYAGQLRRGFKDVGFVGATFVGDRRRERGLVRPGRHTRV